MIHKVPRATERFLKSYGGLNPFGKPKWRLLVSEERLVREAGVYSDWAEGLTTAEKGGLNFSPGVGKCGARLELVVYGSNNNFWIARFPRLGGRADSDAS